MSQPLNNAAALRRQLMDYLPMRAQDPHANPAKLLAYRLSDELAGNALNLDNLETILTDLCRSRARSREKLADRAGLPELPKLAAQVQKVIAQQAKNGFKAFRKWAEGEAVGLVATASDICHDGCHARSCWLPPLARRKERSFPPLLLFAKSHACAMSMPMRKLASPPCMR